MGVSSDDNGIRDFLVGALQTHFVSEESADFAVADPLNAQRAIYFDADGGAFYLLTVEPARIMADYQGPG